MKLLKILLNNKSNLAKLSINKINFYKIIIYYKIIHPILQYYIKIEKTAKITYKRATFLIYYVKIVKVFEVNKRFILILPLNRGKVSKLRKSGQKFLTLCINRNFVLQNYVKSEKSQQLYLKNKKICCKFT